MTMAADDKRTARTLAMREAHGVVGAAVMSRSGRSFVFDFAPVVKRQAPTEDVRITVTKPAVDPVIRARVGKRQTAITTGEDDRLAFLERELARVTALLAATAGEAPVKPAKAAKPAKPAYVPTPEQARRKSAKCPTCQDLGVVRGSGSRAGQAYRTAAGAAAATAPVRCPAKGCKAARKAA